jgi:hypothetical protein
MKEINCETHRSHITDDDNDDDDDDDLSLSWYVTMLTLQIDTVSCRKKKYSPKYALFILIRKHTIINIQECFLLKHVARRL